MHNHSPLGIHEYAMHRVNNSTLSIEAVFGDRGLLASRLDRFEFRPGQLEYARAIQKAIDQEHFLIAEAGTGTGKTLGYLVPAILSGKKAVVSTGTKNLQEQIFFKDIPFLQELLPISFSATLMKGRSNYLCLRKYKLFQQQPLFDFIEDAQLFKKIETWALHTATGDRAEIAGLPETYQPWERIAASAETCSAQRCPLYRDCFVTRMRMRAAKADIVLINHHLFMTDMIIRTAGYNEIIPPYDIIIFDEAHQLESVATQHLGIMVSHHRIEELVRDIQREMAAAHAEGLKDTTQVLSVLLSLSQQFFAAFYRPPESYRIKADHVSEKLWDNYHALVEALSSLCGHIDRMQKKTDELEQCRYRVLTIAQELSTILNLDSATQVSWCELRGSGVTLHSSPIEVGNELAELLYPYIRTIVFSSATLSTNGTFAYFKRRVGLDNIAPPDEIIIPSHFDFASQAILYLPNDMPNPDSAQFVARAAEDIEQVIALTRGRAFILFTSYRNMHEAYAILKDRLPYPVLLQGSTPRHEMLEEFKENISSVLFATSSFWEGVDVMGEALSCVIIDKLPFASPSEPLQEARIEHSAARGENPFLSYQVPQAIITLRQGFGRLIRSRSDRGILCLLDPRINTRHYGTLFLNSLPPCQVTSSITAVKEFLGHGAPV